MLGHILLGATLLLAAMPGARADDGKTFEVMTENGKTLSFRVLACGRILGDKGTRHVRDYDAKGKKIYTQSGRYRIVDERRVPLEAGTRFGCAVSVPRVPRDDFLTIEHVAVRPTRLPDGTVRTDELPYAHKYSSKPVSNPRYWWYRFSERPDKRHAGEWTFLIRNNGRVLISEKFTLDRPGP